MAESDAGERLDRYLALQLSELSRTRIQELIEAGLVLVAFDRATLPWHPGQVIRSGESHGGLILFRRTVRSTNYGEQARLLTEFWAHEGHAWDWLNRFVYLPKSP